MSERSQHGKHQAGGGGSRRRTPPTMERPAAEVAVALAKLRCYGTAVGEIGAAFAIPRERLALAEARDGLEVTARVPIGGLVAPAFASLEEWFSLLGGDLTISLTLAGLDPTEPPVAAALEAEREPRATFAEFREMAERIAATQGDDVAVDARVSIRKVRARAAARTILTRRLEAGDSAEARAAPRVAVYYQAAAWDESLALAVIPAWEELGIFSDEADGERATVVLCDAAGYLAGLALEVVGAAADAPPEWLVVSRAAWRRFGERAAAERGLRDAEGGWAEAPRVLTPEHLRVAARVPGLEATAARLAHLRAALAAAYLASAVQGSWADGLALRFAGPRPTACHLGAVAPSLPSPATEDESEPPAALARLVAWAYRDASSEKLLIARECLARELPAGGEVALADVERAAVPALEAAKANLVLYVRRNIESYFKLRQAAQDAVAAYAETVRRAVGDLTGDVVDNLYRTVGVLAGALLAGLLQPAASLPVLRLATALYAIYVAFVLGVPLRARRDRYRLERRALDERLAAMAELTEAERARLRHPAGEADAHYQHYFWLAAGIYATLGILALIFFILLWTPLAPSLALPHLAARASVR